MAAAAKPADTHQEMWNTTKYVSLAILAARKQSTCSPAPVVNADGQHECKEGDEPSRPLSKSHPPICRGDLHRYLPKSRRLASGRRLIDRAAVKLLQIPVRARQGIVQELSRLADIHTDRLCFLPVHEADSHGNQVSLPSWEETPRPLRVVTNQASTGHVPMVVEGKITVGDENVISGKPAPWTDPNWPKPGGREAFEECVGENVPGSARKED